jgi:hypothetical protein
MERLQLFSGVTFPLAMGPLPTGHVFIARQQGKLLFKCSAQWCVCVCVCMYVCMYTSYSETRTIRRPCPPSYTYIAVLVPQYCPIYQLHNHAALTPATSEGYIKSFGYKVEMFKTTDGCFVRASLHIQCDAKFT